MKTLVFSTTLVLLSLLVSTSFAASGVTYHGRILRSTGTAVDGQFVGFRLKIMDGDTGACEMYQETHTKDMRTANGTFAIIVGDGSVVGTYNVSSISHFDELFLNDRTYNFLAPAGCVSTPYVPSVRDGRILNVQFRESPGDPWEDLPPMTISHVPFAYNALTANQLGSHTQASILRIENAGVPQSISALTPANYTTLMAILGGSYISAVSGTAGQITASTSTGTATLGLADVSGVTPATYGSASLIPVITVDQKGRITTITTAAVSGGGGSAGISALTGDVTASGSGSVAATIAANAVTTTKIADGSVTLAKLASDAVGTSNIADGSVTLAKLASDSVNSSKIVDGTIVGADIAATAALSVASVAATGNVGADTMSTNGIALYELPGNGTNYIMLKGNDNMAANYTLKFPATDGASGQVLATDGSGNLSWQVASTGSITSLTGDVTASGSGAVSATIANDAVTFAKMQNINTNKLLGRSTVASGDVEELSIGTGLSLAAGVLSASGSDTFAGLPCANGYVPYKTAGAWSCLQVTDTNVNSSVVSRDTSGNFVAGTGTFNTSVKITDGAAGGQVTLSAPAAFTSYALKLPSADGGSNQVLKTDGSGNLGWSTALTATTAYVNGGNTFGANATIGLTDAYRLDFKTSNTARMSIDSTGNVSIGTTTTSARLHVRSAGAVGTTFNDVLYGDDSTGQYNAARIRVKDGIADFGADYLAGTPATNVTFSTRPSGGGALAERMRVDGSGNVGIGATSPRSALDVSAGTVLMKASVSNATSTVSFLTGNLQYTANDCGTFALHNMKDGGSYSFAVKGTNSATCVFNAFSDAGSTAITVHMPTDHAATVAGKHTLYTFLVMGTDVYVTWLPGM